MGGLLGRTQVQEPFNPSGTPLEVSEAHRREGNVECNRGRFADACVQYEMGLAVLKDVQVDAPVKETLTELRLSLHLNLALTHLRRGNIYGSAADNLSMPAFTNTWKQSLQLAIEHGDLALAIDPQCEKGYLRRGCARSRFSEVPGQEEIAELASADLEKVLEINPENKEAPKQLKLLKEFGARKQHEKSIGALIRPDAGCHKPVISAEHVHLSGQTDADAHVLSDVCLDLRAGRCLGILAEAGSYGTERSRIADVLFGQLTPSSGRVVHHGKLSVPPGASVSTTVWLVVVSICMLIYAAALVGKDPLSMVALLDDALTWEHGVMFAACGFPLLIMVKIFVDRYHAQNLRYSVLRVAKGDWKWNCAGAKTVAEFICSRMPTNIPEAQRRRRMAAMLKAAGISQEGEVVLDTLSEGEQQSIYLLHCLAARPDVLICDRALDDIDEMQQARILHMLRRMKVELKMAIFYDTSKLDQLRVIADSVGHLCKGYLVELGPAADVLDSPQSTSMKDCVPKCQVKDGKLAKHFAKLCGNSDLDGDWLPL